jgi:hypothetical protein
MLDLITKLGVGSANGRYMDESYPGAYYIDTFMNRYWVGEYWAGYNYVKYGDGWIYTKMTTAEHTLDNKSAISCLKLKRGTP